MILTQEELNRIKYFFSLSLEDYVGDTNELLGMAELEMKDVNSFLEDKQTIVV
jgi:hypothetical protein